MLCALNDEPLAAMASRVKWTPGGTNNQGESWGENAGEPFLLPGSGQLSSVRTTLASLSASFT
jgi:hypothetical protein